MRIKEVFHNNLFIKDLKSTNKESVLLEFSQKLYDEGYITSKEEFLWKLKAREEIYSTGVGDGIAMPHAKSSDLNKTVVLFAKSEQGIDFESMDGQATHFFFVIATPTMSGDEHLKVLANLSASLMKSETQSALKKVTDIESLLNVFNKRETLTIDLSPKSSNIVAITACASGLAHTYMAAEKLDNAGDKIGCRVRVETHGLSGIENRLSKEDIKNAQAVIIASDVDVDMSRFDGKKLIRVSAAQAVYKPEELIKKAMASPVYHHHQNKKNIVDKRKYNDLFGHLLSGISYVLPIVVGGGILIALSFLLDQLIGIPNIAINQLGTYNKIPAHFNMLGQTALTLLLPVLAAYIANSIADRPGILVGFMAGTIAVQGGAGFIGAVLGGFLAGYIMNLLKTVFKNIPKSLFGIKNMLVFPVLGILTVSSLMMLLNIPLSALNTMLYAFLESMSGTHTIILGALAGGMMQLT